MMTPKILLLLLALLLPGYAEAAGGERTILAFGDSLTAGYGLSEADSFPARLEQALRQKGYRVNVVNAGISGDTSAGGASRIAWSLADKPDLAIVELGANDALRGLKPDQTKKNLASILEQLNQAGVNVLLAGMKAPRNLGKEYYNSFDRLYPELAEEYDVRLYPFFLANVAQNPDLNQADGIHPNAAGVRIIVEQMLPIIEDMLRAG